MASGVVSFALSLGLLLVTAQLSFGEQAPCAIRGVISDATGAPLAGAVVSAIPGGAEAVSDETGMYCLARLPAGRYRLRVSMPGFAPYEVPAVNVVATAVTDRPITLQVGFGQEIVVTATRTAQRLEDVPVRTEVISRAVIEGAQARTLADAVEFTTGVRVENNCQTCNFSQIRLLGLEGGYTQILIDGQPTLSALAQVYGIEQIPASMIERIEVVKGGGSAIYGPGSVGGVVNVITREPARGGGNLEARYENTRGGGPNPSLNGALDWVSADRTTFLTAFGQSDSVSAVDVNGDAFTDVARRDLHAMGARLSRYALAGRGKWSVDFSRMTEARRGGDQIDLAPDQAEIAESIQSTRHSGSASWFQSVSPALSYRIAFALADMHRDSYYGTGRDPNAYGDTDNQLAIVDGQVDHVVGRHTASWGLQATHDRLTDRQVGYNRLIDDSFTNVGLFVQDDWSPGRGFQLVYGARADKHSKIDRLIVSPRAALLWSPRPALDVRVSFARGFRAPQPFDEDLHLTSIGGEVRIIRLDPELREETSANYVAGVEWKPVAGRGQALLEANVFHTGLRDLFNIQQDDDPLTDAFEFVRTNLGKAAVYGLELNAGWGIGDSFILQGGVVLQRARFDEPEPDFGSRSFFRTPDHYGVATLVWKDPRRVDLFVGAKMTGRMSTPHYAGFIDEDRLETTRRFVTLDASVARTLWPGRGGTDTSRLALVLGVKNLTNAYQKDLDRGPLRDSDYVYGPRFPRSVSLSLATAF